MRHFSHGTRALRIPHLCVALSAILLVASGCEKLVGISDTPVTNDGSSGSSNAGSGNSDAGKAGMSHAGADTGGSGEAGAPNETGGGSGAGNSAGNVATGGSSGAGLGGGGGGGGGGGTVGTAGSGGTAGSAGTGGASECPCSAPTPTCENGKCIVRGPTMVKVTDSNYYIDSTEVSSAQWDAFIASKPSTAGQRAGCAWNTSFAPSDVTKDDTWPIVYVDFCDAAAYCAWADKRLCGAIAGGGLVGTDPNVDKMPDVTNVTKSQWYLACGGPKEQDYPYGTIENDKACNEDFGNSFPNPVGTLATCQGHYKGLYDMVGNAVEWIDACTADVGKADQCAIIGGSWASNPVSGCYNYSLEPRDSQAPALGFRCCSK